MDFDKMSDEEIAEWYDAHDSITGLPLIGDTLYVTFGDRFYGLVGLRWIQSPLTYTR